MSRLTQENLVAVVLLVVFGGVVYLCQDFGPRARMIPLPLGIFGIVLTVIQLLWQNLRSTDELQMDMISVQRPVAGEEAKPREEVPGERRTTWRRELRAFGIVALLIGLVYAIGVIPAAFVFTAGYFFATRQYGPVASLIYTGIFTGILYLLFIVALQVPPYHGLLEPLVRAYF